MFARAAVETGEVWIVADSERTAQTFMPAAEERAKQTDFITERFAGSAAKQFSHSILF